MGQEHGVGEVLHHEGGKVYKFQALTKHSGSRDSRHFASVL